MKCAICDGDQFHKTDFHKESAVVICKNCGYVCHWRDPKEEEKILEHYRKDYRANKYPQFGNIITTENKKNYISIFLKDFIAGKKGLVFGDVGAATGYLCHAMKQIGHNVTGSEYTTYFRRFSEHYYGIPLTEELETKHKYDLISLYHVLEHMVEPDKKLAHYVSLLKDDGHMLISCPEWFWQLEESAGLPINRFEDLFHKDHIDIFSRQSLKNLFNKVGLEIVKEDFFQYGQSYLVKKGKPTAIVKENWEQRLHELFKIKRSIELLKTEKNAKEAIKEWYAYPEAHLHLIGNEYIKDRYKQEDYFKTLLEKHPPNKNLITAYAGWLYGGQQYKEALDEFLQIIQKVPTADLLIYTGFCYDFLGQHKEAMRYFDWASKVNPVKWAECFEFLSKAACSMPAWDERAKEELKEQLLAAHEKKA